MFFLKKIIHKKIFLYIIFGILTTIINFIVFIFFEYFLEQYYYLLSNAIAFFIATIFAFITNKKFVFLSKNWKVLKVIREGSSFIFARIATFLIIEQFGLIIAVEIININKYILFGIKGIIIIKILLSTITVIFNYLISKLLIFKPQ